MSLHPVDYDPFSLQPVDHDPFQHEPSLKEILLSVLDRHATDTREHIDRLAKIVLAPRKVVHDKDGRPVGVAVSLEE